MRLVPVQELPNFPVGRPRSGVRTEFRAMLPNMEAERWYLIEDMKISRSGVADAARKSGLKFAERTIVENGEKKKLSFVMKPGPALVSIGAAG